MRKTISLLAAVLLTNCSAAGDECASIQVAPAYTNDRSFPIIISDEWSTDDQIQVLEAISFWESVFYDSKIELEVTIENCDLEYGCIRPVEYDPFLKQFDEPDDTFTVIGLHMDGVVSVLFDFEDIEMITVHELGHFFGLGHEDVGAMAPSTSGMTYSLGPESIATLKSHGLL